MPQNSQPARGSHDYPPAAAAVRDHIQSVILETYKTAGFERIYTPVIEPIERLLGSDGGENLSLIFKILKRGEKLNLNAAHENDLADLGLRYDLTVPLSRFYANNQNDLPTPFRTIQIDRVFRAERPQKGRLREFWQCDIDILGDASINAETELIHTAAKALSRLGFSDFTVRINDRRLLTAAIENAGFGTESVPCVCVTYDKLDKIGTDGVRGELTEKGFSAESIEKLLSAEIAPSGDISLIIDTISALSDGKYNIVFDKTLVRGMGYYTGAVFEISAPGFPGSIAGGGRYDNMIGKFLGKPVPAVGFSIGFERIFSIFLDKNFDIPKQRKIALIYGDEDDFGKILTQAEKLRSGSVCVTPIKRAKNAGKQAFRLKEQGFEVREFSR